MFTTYRVCEREILNTTYDLNVGLALGLDTELKLTGLELLYQKLRYERPNGD